MEGQCPTCGQPWPHAKRPLASEIITAMVLGSSYTCDDLRSHDRWDPPLVQLRRRTILALKAAGYSSSAIGKVMNRDHTTVLHALKVGA